MEQFEASTDNDEKTGISGLITDIQRFSLHDGPGIRTTVFLKGCPLRCFWCHNPETWVGKPEVQFFQDRCIGCGSCLKACPLGLHVQDDGRREFRRGQCIACGKCIDVCCTGALAMAGKWWTPHDLLKELIKDRSFYEHSGGGITLSGGEPLMQSGFCLQVLQLCKEAGLHTAIETSAFCRWEDLGGLLPWLDMVIMDIKHLDDEKHKEATGVSNEVILRNTRKLAEAGIPLLIRTPVIPSFNDTPEAIGAIAEFIRPFRNLYYYELMPFHGMAKGKYQSLGLKNKAESLHRPEQETLLALAQCAREKGIADVRIG